MDDGDDEEAQVSVRKRRRPDLEDESAGANGEVHEEPDLQKQQKLGILFYSIFCHLFFF